MQVATIEAGNKQQAQEIAERAVSIMRSGGLVVLPTETVYGVAALAGNDRGFESLCQLKGSSQDQSYTVHIPDVTHVWRYVDTGNCKLACFINKVFPGPVTLIIKQKREKIADKLGALSGNDDTLRKRIYGPDNTIGLRCPDHPLTRQILDMVDAPVIACAANLPGQEAAREAHEVASQLDGCVEMVVDGGMCRYARHSTVVRVWDDERDLRIQVEREGVYDERTIRKFLRWTMLLVCSGNTCRSPMAWALAGQILAKERGISVEDLDNAGFNVISAGVFAAGGMPASVEAVEAMKEYGVDLSSHRSQPISMQLIQEADVIYCMTETQCYVLSEMMPSAAEKIHRLSPEVDIEDPMGMDSSAYISTAENIRYWLEQRIKEQQQ